MSNIIIEKAAIELINDQGFNGGKKLKAIYQHFTLLFVTIMLICTGAVSMSLLYFYQQSQQSKALINEHYSPLHRNFQQQSHLIKANDMIDEVFNTLDPQQFITLQENLSLNSKKLSLLESTHKSTYQQWFIDNNNSVGLVSEIASRHPINELLKNNSLIQLDTLLDAINIQRKQNEISKESLQLFNKVEKQLSVIVFILQSLNIQTSQQDFDKLQASIDEMFLSDYGKMLANQKNYNQEKEEIVRDFIRFEDLVIQRGLLSKWQTSLNLMADYQVLLFSEQDKIQSILNQITIESTKNNDTYNSSVYVDQNLTQQVQIPLWMWLVYTSVLVVVAILLWVIRQRIKITSRYGVEYFSYVLDNKSTPQKTKAQSKLMDQQKKSFFCKESYKLLQKIQDHDNNKFSETEFIALTKNNSDLDAEIMVIKKAKEEFNQVLALAEADASEKITTQLLLEYQEGKKLQLSMIKQLILLGCSSLETINMQEEGDERKTDSDSLYLAHQQSKRLMHKLRQVNCKRYMQMNNVVLTLRDVSLVEQIQAILLNLEDYFLTSKNKVCLEVDERISSQVSLDIILFTEVFEVFVMLLLSQNKQQKLVLRLQLMDKNNAQQKIVFTGKIQRSEKKVKLPQALASVNDESENKDEVASYFDTLLHYQHGENINAEVTEQGYQLSFTLPFVVTNAKEKLHYPSMLIPKALSSIEQEISMLNTKYEAMPIEVLLAVKSPSDFQRLQQILVGMGLQVTFVTNDLMSAEYWESGQYAVILTDIPCSPFISFIIDENEECSLPIALPRGVFTLDPKLSLLPSEDKFSKWKLGNLTEKSSVEEIVVIMSPWLKEQYDSTLEREKTTLADESRIGVESMKTEESGNSVQEKVDAFDFERYCKNQGSAEIALFMLEEYTTENISLNEKLNYAFSVNATDDVNNAISALTVNAKILAANNLLSLCQHWQKLIKSNTINHGDKEQLNLLSKTAKAIEDINRCAKDFS